MYGENSWAEVFYCLFFGILLFAKGIGLYDGQNVFKVFLVTAFLCWVMKMLLTRWSVKEVIITSLFVFLGFVSWRVSGEKAAFVSVLVVTGMKDVSVRKVFRTGMVIWTACFFVMIALSLTGIIDPLMLVHDKSGIGFVVRNSLGYTHPNVLHVSYMILLAFWFGSFSWDTRTALKAVLAGILGNLYVFMYSLSYTGFIMTVAFLILIVYFSCRKNRTKLEDMIIQCLMPICVISSIVLPLVLKGRIFEIADKITNWRFRLTRRYLTNEPISLLGTRFIMDNGSIDCSYVYCLLYYGVILFGIFMLGYFFLIRHLLKKERLCELAMVLGLVAAGFTEPFQFNFSFKNLILVLLGEYFFFLLQQILVNCGWLNYELCLLSAPQKVSALRLSDRKNICGSIGKKAIFAKAVWSIGLVSVIAVSGGVAARTVTVEPYVIVDTSYSDRVGGRDDYLIYGELPDEIIENSMEIGDLQEDSKVYVFDGLTAQMERIRKIVTIMLLSAMSFVIFSGMIYNKYK